MCYSKVVPIGAVVSAASTSLTAGTSYTLNVSDLAFPNPLSSLAALLSLNGQAVAQLTAAGTSSPFTAASGTYQLYALASTSATGSYSATLAPSTGPAALSIARAVSTTGGPVSAYSYDATVANAGSYNLGLADFGIPAAIAPISVAAVQTGAVLGMPLKAPGTASVTAAAGPISLLVFAQPATAGGLFGVALTPGAGGSSVFETTQGVGQLFSARQVSVTTAGNYAVDVSDVGFPSPLATFDVVVTQGASQVGSIFGGGAFSFAATPGNYFVNFIAQPGGSDGAGTYAMSVAPGPSVTLTSDVASVASGGTVNLTWTSQNATACTASGGWNGTQLPSGSVKSSALTSPTTFTLTCTGSGVSASQSVSVTIATPAKSGGGGGRLDAVVLCLLFGVYLLRLSLQTGSAATASRMRDVVTSGRRPQ